MHLMTERRELYSLYFTRELTFSVINDTFSRGVFCSVFVSRYISHVVWQGYMRLREREEKIVYVPGPY